MCFWENGRPCGAADDGRSAALEEPIMMVRVSTISATLLLVPALVFAQASGTGTVTGRVIDSSGGVLPGSRSR
jgi:hypothetical protein